jgi:hypothetical protein
MKMTIVVLLLFPCVFASGSEARFFRVGCLEGDVPANVSIASDVSGQVFLEFDTVDQSVYFLQAAARLDSSPVWGKVVSLTGDGGRMKLATAQRWRKTFGGALGDHANGVCCTSDGGYLLAGAAYSYDPESAAYLVRLDETGHDVWSKTFGGSSTDWATSVRQTPDGGCVLAGITYSYGVGGGDVYLVKIDENGNEVWKSTFGGEGYDSAECVRLTADGGYILAGNTNSFGNGGYDFYLVKADENGGEMWSKTFGGAADDSAYSVQQTADGGYILAGYSRSFDPSEYSDCLLIKTYPDGTEDWSSVLGAQGANEEAHSVLQTSDGGYILAGLTYDFGAGSSDMYLVKTYPNGDRDWHTSFGGTSNDEAYCIRQTSDGGYILAGRTKSFGAGEYDVYLVKARSDGTMIWSNTFGGSSRDQAFGVAQTFDGGYIVGGYTMSFGAGVSDMYVIKTDREGQSP